MANDPFVRDKQKNVIGLRLNEREMAFTQTPERLEIYLADENLPDIFYGYIVERNYRVVNSKDGSGFLMFGNAKAPSEVTSSSSDISFIQRLKKIFKSDNSLEELEKKLSLIKVGMKKQAVIDLVGPCKNITTMADALGQLKGFTANTSSLSSMMDSELWLYKIKRGEYQFDIKNGKVIDVSIRKK